MTVALTVAAQSDAPKRTSGHARRFDIEGLRAVAVIAVVLDHLFQWPRGGFVGVDIFFVISGYLISGILLREASATGRISFKNFYIRRLKRILPAAALVLSVTVTAAYVIFYGGRASSIAADAFWALLFSANWRFAISGTDYMNSGASVSPVQHYWSLGVEEQFYIFWPWIILGALYVARRLRTNQNGRVAVLAVAVGLAIAGSFVFALWETQGNHTVAYFSTFSRSWELGAGALLAILTASFAGFARRVRVVLLWVGMSLLVGSALLITPETPFPAPYALFPVFGACLVILAGTGKDDTSEGWYDRQAWILSNPVSRFIGKISYSLYLWHFPVIVLLVAFVPAASGWFHPVAIVTMIVLSWASFRFVEDPIRRSELGAKKNASGPRAARSPKRRRRAVAGVAAFAAALVAAPLIAFTTVGQQQSIASSEDGNGHGQVTAGAATVDARQDLLRTALGTSDWPVLSPNPAEMGPDGALAKPTEWIKDGCLGGELSPLAHNKDVTVNAKRCVYGDEASTRSMVIFGDSTTMSFVPGIRKAVEGLDWKVYVYTVAACSPIVVPPADDASASECVRFKGWVQDEIRRMRPDTVVSSFLRNDGQLASKATGGKADDEWQRYIAATAEFVTDNGARYVLLEAPAPAKAEPSQCITRFSTPADCVTERAAAFDSQSEVGLRAVAKVGDRAVFVPTKEWFCVDDRCPAFIGPTALYADINHISARASEELAPLLAEVIQLTAAG